MEDFFSWILDISQKNNLSPVQFLLKDGWVKIAGRSFRFLHLNEKPDPFDDSTIIWEDWWSFKQDIVKSKILGMFGLLERVPGRLCQIRRIDKTIADGFLRENHLQGTTTSKIKYGIFLPSRYFRVLKTERNGDELMLGVMTFSGVRAFRDGSKSYELLRFGVRKGMSIQGGFTKMLKCFVTEKKPDSVMTYVDLDWYSGHGYVEAGFEESGSFPPIYYRISKDGEREKVTSVEDFEVISKGSLKMIWKKK